LALLKFATTGSMTPPLMVLTAGYVIFAALFGYLVFGRGAACVVAAPDK
jgi:hypothetical protein